MAYINTDVCLSGPILEPVASPTLMDLMVPATKDVQSPFDDNLSYYEYWKKWSEEGESFDPEADKPQSFGKYNILNLSGVSFCWSWK